MKDFIVNDEKTLEKMLARVRAAQEKFANYTQEQVDKIFFAAAMAADKARIPLAKHAVDETGMGVVEDKVIKNHYAAEYIYNKYKDAKTCGVIERDEAFGYTRIAEPIGVLAAVIPTTNPTSTAIFKALICLKTRNGLIISPASSGEEMHDRSGESSFGGGGKSGRSGRNHRLDRRAERSAFGNGHEGSGHDFSDGRSRHGSRGVFVREARHRRRGGKHARGRGHIGGYSARGFVYTPFQDLR